MDPCPSQQSRRDTEPMVSDPEEPLCKREPAEAAAQAFLETLGRREASRVESSSRAPQAQMDATGNTEGLPHSVCLSPGPLPWSLSLRVFPHKI